MFSSSDMFATGRCRYPSKFCSNARARKRNGELHRFCEEHRAKANDNQKRWSSSRQRQWDAMEAAAAGSHAHCQYGHGEPLAGASPSYGGLEPQPLYLLDPSKPMMPPTPARPQLLSRTPSQSDRFLTHLLYQRSQSSTDMDVYDVGGAGPGAVISGTPWQPTTTERM